MKLSEKRHAAIYAAIHRVITDTRLEVIRKSGHGAHHPSDFIIAQAEHALNAAVLDVLRAAPKETGR